jgi:hypothetical protein
MSMMIRNGVRRMLQEIEARPTFDAASMYLRSLVMEIGFRNAATDALKAANGYAYLYPQAVAIDEQTWELFVLLGPDEASADKRGWIQVYDLNTGALKRTFTTGEKWRECLIIRYVGGVRRLYSANANNMLYSVDITVLPADMGATGAPTLHVPAYSQVAFDGKSFIVQEPRTYRGEIRRNHFAVYDADTFVKTGGFALPFDAIGSIQAYIDYFPKLQGMAAYNGCLFVGTGAAYVPGTHDPKSNGKLAGLQAFTATGEKLGAALCSPEDMRAIFAAKLGYTPSVIESEGVTVAGGSLYGCWVTLGPTERELPAKAGKGVVITLEMARGADRMDFRPAAMNNRIALDSTKVAGEIAHGSGQLANPVTGDALLSFRNIMDFMNAADLPFYRFNGTNQAVTDYDGVAVAMEGRMIDCYNINGYSFLFQVKGNLNSEEYWVTNGIQTRQPIVMGGAGGAATLEGVALAPGGVGKIVTGRKTAAQATHWEMWNSNGIVGYVAAVGTGVRYYTSYSANVFDGCGVGTPEGVVVGGVGSTWRRTDGGAGTTFYVKQSGASNTNIGWVAK